MSNTATWTWSCRCTLGEARERDRARRRPILGGKAEGTVVARTVVGVGRRGTARGVGRDRLDLRWPVIPGEEDAPDEWCDQGECKQRHKAADDQAAATLAAVDHDFLTDLLLAGVDPPLSEFGL